MGRRGSGTPLLQWRSFVCWRERCGPCRSAGGRGGAQRETRGIAQRVFLAAPWMLDTFMLADVGSLRGVEVCGVRILIKDCARLVGLDHRAPEDEREREIFSNTKQL